MWKMFCLGADLACSPLAKDAASPLFAGTWPAKTGLFRGMENVMTDCKTKYVISLVAQPHCLTITTIYSSCCLCCAVSWRTAWEHMQDRNNVSTSLLQVNLQEATNFQGYVAKKARRAQLGRTGDVFPGRDAFGLSLHTKSTANIIS